MKQYSNQDVVMKHFNKITFRDVRDAIINWIVQTSHLLDVNGLCERCGGFCKVKVFVPKDPLQLTEENASNTGIAIGNSMAGDLFLGRPFEIGSFEKELNDMRAKNRWRITIEFTGTLIVTVFDKESGKKLAETGATSLLGILWALQQPLDSNNWLWNRF